MSNGNDGHDETGLQKRHPQLLPPTARRDIAELNASAPQALTGWRREKWIAASGVRKILDEDEARDIPGGGGDDLGSLGRRGPASAGGGLEDVDDDGRPRRGKTRAGAEWVRGLVARGRLGGSRLSGRRCMTFAR